MNEGTHSLFGEGLFGIILFLIVAGVFNNGGLFGGNNRGVDQVTNEFLFNNLANQNRDIMAGINGVDRDVLTTSCNTDKEILESRYTTQMGFQNLSAQIANCCCDIKTSIHAEGEATRDLITQNTIQDLRERLSLANNTISSQTLANDIVNQVRPCPIPAYLSCSPYASYGYNGCCNATVI